MVGGQHQSDELTRDRAEQVNALKTKNRFSDRRFPRERRGVPKKEKKTL
jgi:hypothetical protein